jgi:hypothetical protein
MIAHGFDEAPGALPASWRQCPASSAQSRRALRYNSCSGAPGCKAITYHTGRLIDGVPMLGEFLKLSNSKPCLGKKPYLPIQGIHVLLMDELFNVCYYFPFICIWLGSQFMSYQAVVCELNRVNAA